jgi:peptidyl-tRNA hydrolase ICT1
MGVKLPTEQLSRFTEAKEHGAARSGDVTMLAEASADPEAEPAQQPPVDLSSRPVTKDDVEVQFVRSSGPGGQNVNKLSTKVSLRWNVQGADWLPEPVRAEILRAVPNRINSAGELVCSSDKTRTQRGNLDDALRKLQKVIDKATKDITPKEKDPKKEKKYKKMLKKANEKRLENKKRSSDKKSMRRQKNFD